MINIAASGWGRLIGLYSRRVVSPSRIRVSWARPGLPSPCIWVCFHEANMIAIAVHAAVLGRPAAGVVPGGAAGAAMAGWFEALGIESVRVESERDSRRGLRALASCLDAGADVLLAVDGPRGPRRQVKPGALWIAAMTGVPVVPFGAAASAHVRLPRWDRLMVPLPGARIAARVGAPCAVAGEEVRAGGDRLGQAIRDANADAAAMLSAGPPLLVGET